MGFAESWNRYSALAFGAPAAGASTTSTVGANTTFEQKMIMLRSLQEALADARQSGDTRALKIYQEQMDAYTASEAARVRVINTLAQNQGRLDAAKLQAVQRDIANIRDNQTRLLAADAQRGQRMMQQLVYNAAAADPRLASSQNPDPFIDFVLSVASRSLNPDDPASWYALDALRSQYGAGRVNAKLGNLTGRIEAAHGAREAQVRGLQEISIPPTATGRDVEGLLSAAGLTAMERPTFDAAREAAGAVTGEEELKSDIDRLQRDLDLTGTEAATKPDRYGGLSESEVQDMLSDPRFRSYAEDRGFRLSAPRADGTYIVTPQDINALRAAAREQSTGRSPLFRGANRPREQMDLQVVRPGVPGENPSLTVSRYDDTEQFALEGYITYPNGHVARVDLRTGEAEDLRDRDGRWLGTPAELAEYNRVRSEEPSSLLVNPETKKPLTFADIQARVGNEGLDLNTVDLESPSKNTRTPEQLEDIRGLRMPTRLGEDPERVARMLDQDGTTVVTYEKGDDGMWRETAREENAYRGIMRRPESGSPAAGVVPELREPAPSPAERRETRIAKRVMRREQREMDKTPAAFRDPEQRAREDQKGDTKAAKPSEIPLRPAATFGERPMINFPSVAGSGGAGEALSRTQLTAVYGEDYDWLLPYKSGRTLPQKEGESTAYNKRESAQARAALPEARARIEQGVGNQPPRKFYDTFNPPSRNEQRAQAIRAAREKRGIARADRQRERAARGGPEVQYAPAMTPEEWARAQAAAAPQQPAAAPVTPTTPPQTTRSSTPASAEDQSTQGERVVVADPGWLDEEAGSEVKTSAPRPSLGFRGPAPPSDFSPLRFDLNESRAHLGRGSKRVVDVRTASEQKPRVWQSEPPAALAPPEGVPPSYYNPTKTPPLSPTSKALRLLLALRKPPKT